MNASNGWLSGLWSFVPSAVTIAVAVVLMFAIQFILERRRRSGRGRRLEQQLTMVVLTIVVVLVIVVTLPIRDATRGQLLSLIGIVLSAAIALSATTFVGNAMAGIMLRAVRNFRTGDFVRVCDQFGRVSQRGLFHTEIQTEDRDLTTLPNLYLVTNPVKVIRSSGTILSATVSLGYDAPCGRIEELLLQAAHEVGLEDPFMHILELGDFSVTYRVAGLLRDVNHLLSARSRLRRMMLDALHDGGVEIVSPTFMNTRAFMPTDQFVPHESDVPPAVVSTAVPEAIAFDKADAAQAVESLDEDHAAILKQIAELKKRKPDPAADPDAKDKQLEALEARRDRMAEMIERRNSND